MGRNREPVRLRNQRRVREIRQARLTSEERPLRLNAVVDEAALHRRIGGARTMREQLLHLAVVANLPTVSLQVLPFQCGAHRSLEGSFIVLEFPEPEDPPMLYVEFPTGSLHIEDLGKVQEAKLRFEELRKTALDPAHSVALLGRLADELYGP
jgi:hypothetical protein